MQSTLMINQNVLAGNQFSGDVSPTDAEGPSSPVKRPPPAGTPSSWSYNDLVDGGLFDFFVPGSPGLPVQKHSLQIDRIVLNLGNAASWTLDVLTDDGNGNPLTLNLLNSVDVAGNTLEQFTVFGKIFPGEKLILTTVGATTALFAQIAVSPLSR
jgi:hypothetical protein